MTNTNNELDNLTAAIIAATDRRIAQVRADRDAFVPPAAPAVRTPPKARNRYRRRRAIR